MDDTLIWMYKILCTPPDLLQVYEAEIWKEREEALLGVLKGINESLLPSIEMKEK